MGSNDEKSEIERLVYKGYKIPNGLRLAWTLLILWSLYYLLSYAWPDLSHWLKLGPDGEP